MEKIKAWIRQIKAVRQKSIRNQVLALVLVCGLLIFLSVSALSLYALESTCKALENHGRSVSRLVAESVGESAENNARDWLRQMAEAEASYIDRELEINGEDATILAQTMSQILTHPEYYRPRQLPLSDRSEDIVSGMPYIHYSPALRQQGIPAELAQEIGLAANFADALVPLSKTYKNYRTSLLAASKHGYMICVDIVPGNDEEKSIFPSAAKKADFLANYDPRERPWYKSAQQKNKLDFTAVYLGEDGYFEVSCTVPYYDAEGFAGVVNIGSSVEDVHKQVMNVAAGVKGICFALDERGNITFSSEQAGTLAAVPGDYDIRRSGETALAKAAEHMVTGKSDVERVTVDGKDYYLAYAPMPKLQWSFGMLISTDVVMAPAQQASGDVLAKMESFAEEVQQIFLATAGKEALLLLPLLFIAFYGSSVMAARVTKPIRQLAAGVKEIAAGNLHKKLAIHESNEIGHLAICFNAMTDELQRHMDELAQATAKAERAKTELEVAASIQAGMLPEAIKAERYKGQLDLAAMMHPAKMVGGDFYDFYFMDEDNLVLTIADVSDKGVPASLFMVIAKTLLKDQALVKKSADRLADIVAAANDALAASNREMMFVTTFIGVLHLPTGKFTYVNAGHNAPIVGQGTDWAYLPKATDPILGVRDGLTFTARQLTLARGTAMLLYTDGVTEAMDKQQEQFGEAQLRQTLAEMPAGSDAAEMLKRVRAAVKDHAGAAEQSDDITMLGFVYRGPSGTA